jgi:O-antigen ligase
VYRNYNLRHEKSFVRDKSNIVLNDLILLYAFFVPISEEMSKYFLNLMLIIWLLDKDIFSKLKKMIQNKVIQSILLFLLLLILSLLWTDPENIKTGMRYIKYYAYLLPLFIIYTSIRKEYIHYAISAFLMSMLLSELVSYGIFFELLDATMIPFTRDDAVPMNPSAFLHHTTYSMFLVVTAGILLDRFFLSQEIKYKLIYGLFFVLVTTNLFINAGRTGQIAYFVTMLAIILVHYKISIKMFLATSALFVSIVFLAFTFSPVFKQRLDQTINSLSHPNNYHTSLGYRIGMSIIAVNIIKEHPWLGVGVGDYRQAKSDMIDARYPMMEHLKGQVHYHNQYLEFLVIMGIIGLIIYLSIYFFLTKTIIKDEEIRSIKYIIIITIILSSLTDAMFHLKSPLSLFAVFVGIILAKSYFENEPTTSKKS